MISRLPAQRRLFSKASKKPLNSEQVLVSRKAMQNYNRFLEQANIFTTFFQKNAVFLRFAWFRTPSWRFRTAASAMLPVFSTWRPPVSIAVVQQCTGPEGILETRACARVYIIMCHLLERVTMGTSISSIEIPPCWKVSRKYCT